MLPTTRDLVRVVPEGQLAFVSGPFYEGSSRGIMSEIDYIQ
jgi:hypothetical protein